MELAICLDAGAQALGVAYAQAGRREDAERVAAIVPRPFQSDHLRSFGRQGPHVRSSGSRGSVGPDSDGKGRSQSPEFALLRGDPRLKALRKKVGLPE